MEDTVVGGEEEEDTVAGGEEEEDTVVGVEKEEPDVEGGEDEKMVVSLSTPRLPHITRIASNLASNLKLSSKQVLEDTRTSKRAKAPKMQTVIPRATLRMEVRTNSL